MGRHNVESIEKRQHEMQALFEEMRDEFKAELRTQALEMKSLTSSMAQRFSVESSIANVGNIGKNLQRQAQPFGTGLSLNTHSPVRPLRLESIRDADALTEANSSVPTDQYKDAQS